MCGPCVSRGVCECDVDVSIDRGEVGECLIDGVEEMPPLVLEDVEVCIGVVGVHRYALANAHTHHTPQHITKHKTHHTPQHQHHTLSPLHIRHKYT
jgi:hypothetical protein